MEIKMNKFLKKAEGFFASRGFSAGVVTALVIALVVVANVIIYTLTALFGLYIYSPTARDYGISGVTDAVLAEAEEAGEPVTLTFCMAESDLEVHSTGRFVLETARAYAERYSFVRLKFINLLTKMDENGTIVKNLDRYKTDMRGKETPLSTTSVIFSSGEGKNENYRVLTDVQTTAGFSDFYTLDSEGNPYAYSGEEVIGSMISWVLTKEHKVAYFTENHGETVDMTLGHLLACAGYYIETINLRTTGAVPDDAAFLAISNPISDFESADDGAEVDTELERIDRYLASGGKMYVAIDPYSKELKNLEALLREYGITLSGKDGRYGYSRELVLDPSAAFPTDSMSFVASFGDSAMASRITDNIADSDNKRVLLSQVSKLELDPALGAEALLLSSPSSRVLWEGETVSEKGGYAVAAYSTRDEGEGVSSAVVVIPTVLMTGADVLVSNGYSNRDFVYSILSEVFGAPTVIYGARSVIYNSGVVENLTQSSAVAFTVLLMIIPVALAVLGAVVVIRRKRR